MGVQAVSDWPTTQPYSKQRHPARQCWLHFHKTHISIQHPNNRYLIVTRNLKEKKKKKKYIQSKEDYYIFASRFSNLIEYRFGYKISIVPPKCRWSVQREKHNQFYILSFKLVKEYPKSSVYRLIKSFFSSIYIFYFFLQSLNTIGQWKKKSRPTSEPLIEKNSRNYNQ